jgi:DNA-binding NtrC family response regulator
MIMNPGIFPLLWTVMQSGVPSSDDVQRRRNRDVAAQPPCPCRVLVVDDNPDICVIVTAALKAAKSNWQVECAASLTETLVHLAEHKIDVIMLDLCLGDSNGLDTLERVHRVAGDAAIVVMTGMDEDTTAPQAMNTGAQDFISKPLFDTHELPGVLCQAIESRRLLKNVVARNELAAGENQPYGACNV